VLRAATSLFCATLLVRGHVPAHFRLLSWTSVCFVALAANNILLFTDLVIAEEADLTMLRGLTSRPHSCCSELTGRGWDWTSRPLFRGTICTHHCWDCSP
jgi:hypothetical protein